MAVRRNNLRQLGANAGRNRRISGIARSTPCARPMKRAGFTPLAYMLGCFSNQNWERDMFLWPEIASGTLRLGYVQAGPVRTRYVEAGDPSADEAVVFIPGTGGHLEAFTQIGRAHV